MTLTSESWYGESESYHNWSLPFVLLLKGLWCCVWLLLSSKLLNFVFFFSICYSGLVILSFACTDMLKLWQQIQQGIRPRTACFGPHVWLTFVIWLILICKYFQGGRRCRMQSHHSLFMLLIGFHAYLFLQFLLLSLWSSWADDSIWLTRSVSICLHNDVPKQFWAFNYPIYIYCWELIKSVKCNGCIAFVYMLWSYDHTLFCLLGSSCCLAHVTCTITNFPANRSLHQLIDIHVSLEILVFSVGLIFH